MSGFSGAPVQTTATQNPLYQGQAQQYANMTEEQLQELAIRAKGSPQGAIVQRVLQQKRMQRQPMAQAAQAAPAAPDAAGLPQAYALGGMLEAKGGVRMPERGISMGATPPTGGGFLHTAGPGRTDNLRINPKADSYVIPADVTSGMGQGNSLAGAKAFQTAIKSAPYGAGMPTATHAGHRMGPPHMGRAEGGAAKTVAVKAAGGEIVLTPEEVRSIGHAHCAPGSKQCSERHDIDLGHKILDALVLRVRAQTIKDLKGLKGPVRS